MLQDLWYKNAIVYCLSVGTYMDANGDGIGDFQGLMRRLDYLHGLGVTAVWLMPFQCSPGRDDGYDVSDYYGVDPAFGTLGDFVEFTHGAKQRGIRVLIDLVVNHTSDQHAWFQEARRDPKSKYRNWYIWSKKRPPHADQGMVFPGVQKTTWSYDEAAKEWYFHRFYEFQPDLNTANPEVQAEILKIMGFWIQLGVSGFRMDAVPFVIGTKGPDVKKPREQYDMLRDVPRIPAVAGRRFHHPGRGQRAAEDRHAVFRRRRRPHAHDVQFPGQPEPVLCARGRRRPPAGEGAEDRPRPRPASGQWGIFLRNHDELDLGRLTEQAAPDRCSTPSGRIAKTQLYDRGIRRRLAPMLHGDRRRLELAYSLMFTLPGTPVHALRRRARHGRRPVAARARRAAARRCSGRPSRMAASRRATSRSFRSSAADRTATSTSTRPSSGATPIRC